jgi:hypothetical protein
MKQKIIQTIPAAKNAADLIIGGMNELGATITFHYNVKDEIVEEMTNMIMATGNHEQSKQVKATRRNAMLDALNLAQKKIRVVRDLLKLTLGYDYSDIWTALGFKTTLGLPDDLEEVKAILQAMVLHFANNPAHEVAALGATGAQVLTSLEALLAAQLAFVSQEATVKELMDLRDEKYEIVRKRIGSVYRELGNHLDPLDRRWSKFGFNAPGADETPEQVAGVKVTLIGATAAAVKWEASPRAQYYRVWFRIHGTEAEYVTVGSPADLDFTIENLPANTAVDIVVTAMNNGGESPISEAVTITTH